LNLIAKNNGYDTSKVPEAYLSELKGREKIGSSQRYGYNYCEQSLWGALPHIQLFLDEMVRSYRRAIEVRHVSS
jgi:asparagine synthase (glutamine-hydrolysing)